eukprot:3373147-Rhodomonas_salina.1
MRWRWGARRAERGREEGGAPEGEENARGSAATGIQNGGQLLNFNVSGTAESHRTCANSSDRRSQWDSDCTGTRSVE